MAYTITVRLSEELQRLVEQVRDPKEHPTLSDFVRRAVERYAREIRRRRIAEECRSLADDNLLEWAEADLPDYAERVAQAEKGEL
ncbi:MAG: YlcI/YnfO family protein [Moorellales bacterium]